MLMFEEPTQVTVSPFQKKNLFRTVANQTSPTSSLSEPAEKAAGTCRCMNLLLAVWFDTEIENQRTEEDVKNGVVGFYCITHIWL